MNMSRIGDAAAALLVDRLTAPLRVTSALMRLSVREYQKQRLREYAGLFGPWRIARDQAEGRVVTHVEAAPRGDTAVLAGAAVWAGASAALFVLTGAVWPAVVLYLAGGTVRAMEEMYR